MPCRALRIWARRPDAAAALADDASRKGWRAAAVGSVGALVADCDLIFTCTPAAKPLVLAAHVAARPPTAPGLHICALGADAAGKQEAPPRAALEPARSESARQTPSRNISLTLVSLAHGLVGAGCVFW